MKMEDDANWYWALIGKSISTRPLLANDRNDLINEYVKAIVGVDEHNLAITEFCEVVCMMLDYYGVFLDAEYELTNTEIDELCFRLFIPRKGFDRFVRIAMIQKQAPCEIDNARLCGKKWVSDPVFLERISQA